MMLAELATQTPVGLAAWLGCAAFVVMLINGGFKLARNVKGEPPQPANPQLGQSVSELGRRVNALEQWRNELIEKLESDKAEMLQAGEMRASSIHAHIETDRREMHAMELRLDKKNEDRVSDVHQRINEVLGAVSELRGVIKSK